MTALPDPRPWTSRCRSYRPVFVAAMLLIACLAATLVGWGMFARLDSAVVAHGVLYAESQRKTVEHLEGGILRELSRQGRRPRAARARSSPCSTPPRSNPSSPSSTPTSSSLTYEIWRLEAEYAGADRPRPRHRPRRRPSKAATPRSPPRPASSTPASAPTTARSPRLERQIDQLAAEAAGERRPRPLRRAPARQLAGRARPKAASLVAKGATPAPEAPRARPQHRPRRGRPRRGPRPRRRRRPSRSPAPASTSRRCASSAWSRSARSSPRTAAASPRSRARSAARPTSSSATACARRSPASSSTSPPSRPGAIVGSGVPLMEIIPDGDRLIAEARLAPRRHRHRPRRPRGAGPPHRLQARQGADDHGRGHLRLGRPPRGRARRLDLLRGPRQPSTPPRSPTSPPASP